MSCFPIEGEGSGSQNPGSTKISEFQTSFMVKQYGDFFDLRLPLGLRIIAVLPAIILSLITLGPALIGFGYLLAGILTSAPWEISSHNRPRWLKQLIDSHNELSKSKYVLLRRMRFLFGTALISFSASVAAMMFLFGTAAENQELTIAGAMSYISPVLLLQAMSFFLIRQTSNHQTTLSELQLAIEISHSRLSIAFSAEENDGEKERLWQMIGMPKKQTDNGDNDAESEELSSQNIRTIASFLAALSRFTQ